MIDRLFTAALAFTLLTGATFAVAEAWFNSRSTVQVTHLPKVTVVAKRAPAPIDVASRDVAQPVTLQ